MVEGPSLLLLSSEFLKLPVALWIRKGHFIGGPSLFGSGDAHCNAYSVLSVLVSIIQFF